MATNNALNNASSPFTVSSGNLVVTTGNVSTSAGSITSATTLTASSGDVTITSGNLLLPMTTSTVGQISFAGRRYFHIYGTNGDTGNLFVGSNAGNFTASGAGLAFNYGFGGLVFAALTTGQYNVGMGYGSLGVMTTGSQNTCVGGVSVLDALTTGSYNTGIGAGTLHSLITGAGNIAIGLYGVSLGSGRIYTGSESWNICIGAGGTIGESNVLRIGTQEAAGVGVNKAYIAGIYNTAVGATAGVVLSDSAHQLGGLAGAAGTVLIGGTKPAFSATPSCTDLTLSGNLLLPTTSSTVGQIKMNSVRYMHSYGTDNLFFGANSGNFILTATQSLCLGASTGAALTTGSYNTLISSGSGQSITSGQYNTIIGIGAAGSLLTGNFNLILEAGFTASALTSSESSNIYIQNTGVTGDNNIIRIGTAGSGNGQQNKCFIAGIRGITTDAADAIAVLVSSTGQLGTVSSSRKVKDNIDDINNDSDVIYSLRPVTFTWKSNANAGKQYGLIAEEVAETFPYLAVLNKDGEPESVHYDRLPAILLNEIQKLQKRIIGLEARLVTLEKQ